MTTGSGETALRWYDGAPYWGRLANGEIGGKVWAGDCGGELIINASSSRDTSRAAAAFRDCSSNDSAAGGVGTRA